MKSLSKAEIREELQQEMERYLQGGGRVETIPRGLSGMSPGDPPVFKRQQLFTEPSAPRTLVPEVVAAIEARRRQSGARRNESKTRRSRRPRLKILYDDFGEPLRRVWTDD